VRARRSLALEGVVKAPKCSDGLSKLNSLDPPSWSGNVSVDVFQASQSAGRRYAITGSGAYSRTLARRLHFPRKEVIQPQLPLRLPCYDFTPITDSTFGRCLPYGLAHGLRAFPAFVV
jgi:hypothetical protein